jgi:hypothetical protein
MLLLHRLKLLNNLLEAVSRSDLVISCPKNTDANPRDRVHKAQAPLFLLSKLGKHLPHNIHLEGLGG